MDIVSNKWLEKIWRDPAKHRITPTKPIEDDSTPLVKRASDKEIKITYHRATRIKTLRGIRR